MNEIERHLARAAGKTTVEAGEEIIAAVDLVIAHDVTGPMAVEQFQRIGMDHVFDQQRVVFVLDHIIPAATVEARALHNTLRNFSRRFNTVLYDKGQGVIHQVVAEKHNLPRGAVIVGADSHTCTAGARGLIAIGVGATELAAAMATGAIDLEVPEAYEIRLEGKMSPGVYAKDVILHLIGKFGTGGFTDQAVIFAGGGAAGMSLQEKMTIANMGIEMGAMITYFSDLDMVGPVRETFTFDLAAVPPSVACPYSPGNVVPVREAAGTAITQVVIGSCTNGRLSDMEVAAEVLQGKKVHSGVTLLIVPASQEIAQAMEDRGLTKVLRESGAMVTSPGCGPCFGAHMGLLTADDAAVSTTNRNFPGRMGAREARVYLASPRTAAESAVAGKIVAPGTVAPLDRGC